MVLSGLLAWLAPRKRRDGEILFAYLAGYAVLRFVVEGFRGDARGVFLVPALSFSQGLSLVVVGVSAFLLLVLPKRYGVGVTHPIGPGSRTP